MQRNLGYMLQTSYDASLQEAPRLNSRPAHPLELYSLNAGHLLTTLYRVSNLPFALLHHLPLQDIHVCLGNAFVIIGDPLTSYVTVIHTEAVRDGLEHDNMIDTSVLIRRS